MCVRVRGRQTGRNASCKFVGLGSRRWNIMTDSLSESSMRYVEMIVGKSAEEWSSQNGMMLRCTGDSMCAIAQMCGQSMEAEVLIDVANVKDNLLIHKRDSHSCAGLGSMRAFGFNHAEQASCTLT